MTISSSYPNTHHKISEFWTSLANVGSSPIPSCCGAAFVVLQEESQASCNEGQASF